MAKVIWTEPALSDLDAIADYIALDKPSAAARTVQAIYDRAQALTQFRKWVSATRARSVTFEFSGAP